MNTLPVVYIFYTEHCFLTHLEMCEIFVWTLYTLLSCSKVNSDAVICVQGILYMSIESALDGESQATQISEAAKLHTTRDNLPRSGWNAAVVR